MREISEGIFPMWKRVVYQFVRSSALTRPGSPKAVTIQQEEMLDLIPAFSKEKENLIPSRNGFTVS